MRPYDDRERNARPRRIVLSTGAITVAHFGLGTRTHLLHGWHILLAFLALRALVEGWQVPGETT